MRVVIAEDSVLLRQGLARLLADEGFEVTGQVDNAADLLHRVSRDRPDVAIVDIRMPPSHSNEGLVAAERIRTSHPNVGVLVLSQYAEPAYALQLLESNATHIGYLLKDRVLDAGEIAAALRRITDGESVIDRTLVAQLVDRRRERSPLDDRGIADRLVVSHKAVEARGTRLRSQREPRAHAGRRSRAAHQRSPTRLSRDTPRVLPRHRAPGGFPGKAQMTRQEAPGPVARPGGAAHGKEASAYSPNAATRSSHPSKVPLKRVQKRLHSAAATASRETK